LEREALVMHGVRFIGTTLWTDFDALAAREPPERQLKAREKAFRAANYYLKKALVSRHGTPWLAEGLREQAMTCQAWLRAALAVPHEGPTVVVTHFAPSLKSADPRYGMVPGTAGFCNALDDLLPAADLWLDGCGGWRRRHRRSQRPRICGKDFSNQLFARHHSTTRADDPRPCGKTRKGPRSAICRAGCQSHAK
jgi:hypothetical protein